MVLETAVYAFQTFGDFTYVRYLLYAVIALVGLRIWSSVASLRERRVLHGKNIIISVCQERFQMKRRTALTELLIGRIVAFEPFVGLSVDICFQILR